MTTHELLKILAQVALQWDRKEYKELTAEQAWELGYDSAGPVLFMDNFIGALDVEAIASAGKPDEVEVMLPDGRVAVLNMETGSVQM